MIPDTPPAIVERIREVQVILQESFAEMAQALRTAIEISAPAFRKDEVRTQLEQFDRSVAKFSAALQDNKRLVDDLIHDNRALRNEVIRLRQARRSEDEYELNQPLFFSHIRQAWSILRYR